MQVLSLIQIDPATREATGTVVYCCSETCRHQAKSSIGIPNLIEGISNYHDDADHRDFGLAAQCGQCGAEITTGVNTSNDDRALPSVEAVDYTYYLRHDVVTGMLELRQTRYREQLNAGTSHPHDICAYARNKAEMEHMVSLYKLGAVDWASIPDWSGGEIG